jgi:hypothetical protein
MMKLKSGRARVLVVLAAVVGLVGLTAGCKTPVANGMSIGVVDNNGTRQVWAELYNPGMCTATLTTGADGRDLNHYSVAPGTTLAWQAVLFGPTTSVLFVRWNCYDRVATYVIAPGPNGPGYWMYGVSPDSPPPTMHECTPANPCLSDGARHAVALPAAS